jgi:hypothetical protein
VNTDKLAKHYPNLSSAERLSLLLAAAARGDDLEHTRLADAEPWVDWRVPHTFGRSLAFLLVCAYHRMEQLELAALFFKASAVADAIRGELSTKCRNAAKLYGYLVKINEEGWLKFCEREQLNAGVCIAVLPGECALALAAEEAELVGLAASELLDYARLHKETPFTPKTAESVADALQAIYKMFVERWE